MKKFTKTWYRKGRSDLRKYLVNLTDCNSNDKWPCGSCLAAALAGMGVGHGQKVEQFYQIMGQIKRAK
jgi:hypothetical protein